MRRCGGVAGPNMAAAACLLGEPIRSELAHQMSQGQPFRAAADVRYWKRQSGSRGLPSCAALLPGSQSASQPAGTQMSAVAVDDNRQIRLRLALYLLVTVGQW